jgi:hypothetical protein
VAVPALSSRFAALDAAASPLLTNALVLAYDEDDDIDEDDDDDEA